MDLQKILQSVEKAAKSAAEYIARERRENFTDDRIELKGRNNLVSYVDKTAEAMLVSDLAELVTGAGFICEEGTATRGPKEGWNWIIDPLDGTTNFVHGLPPYCVSIGLAQGDEVMLGVIYVITSDECFSAVKGGGAFINGVRIATSKIADLSQALVLSGVAYDLSGGQKGDFMRLFDYFNNNSHGARRTGSAAANMAYVAAGRVEAFYQVNLSPWDVAAGILLVEEAGGRVTDFNGGPNALFGKQIIATNGNLHTKIQEIVNQK